MELQASAPSVAEGRARSIRVLLVDDSSRFLTAARRYLSSFPWIDLVGCSHSGQDAVTEVGRLRPDLVVMDLAMPDMSGLQATRHIKAGPEPPRVVIMTLEDGTGYRSAAEAAGADGLVPKWDLADRLVPEIQALCS